MVAQWMRHCFVNFVECYAEVVLLIGVVYAPVMVIYYWNNALQKYRFETIWDNLMVKSLVS